MCPRRRLLPTVSVGFFCFTTEVVDQRCRPADVRKFINKQLIYFSSFCCFTVFKNFKEEEAFCVKQSEIKKTNPIFIKPGEKFKLIRTIKERSCDKNLPQEGSQTLLKTNKVSRGRRSRWLIMRDVCFLFPTNRPKHSTSFNLKPPWFLNLRHVRLCAWTWTKVM